MTLITPQLQKSELLRLTGISSTTFNNWRLRGLIPFNDLGFKMESLTRYKYSVLLAAFCKSLSYHTGSDRKLYVKTLKDLFIQISKQNDFNDSLVIAISGWGKGKDCGVFEDFQTAMTLCPKQCSYVPVGKIIKQYMEQQDG